MFKPTCTCFPIKKRSPTLFNVIVCLIQKSIDYRLEGKTLLSYFLQDYKQHVPSPLITFCDFIDSMESATFITFCWHPENFPPLGVSNRSNNDSLLSNSRTLFFPAVEKKLISLPSFQPRLGL